MLPSSYPAYTTLIRQQGGFEVTGAQREWCLGWVATARDSTISSVTPNLPNVSDSSTRTATSCFMRGLRENIEIETSSAQPWQWRRICFTFKGLDLLRDSAGVLQQMWNETSNGFERGLFSLINVTVPATAVFGNIQSLLFTGQLNIDYLDFMTAKTNRNIVTVVYDKTTFIRSSNDDGTLAKRKIWHGMNKTLVYGDDEAGGTEVTNSLSSNAKRSMGDYYVLDFFKSAIGSTADDILRFTPQSTLYWHER